MNNAWIIRPKPHGHNRLQDFLEKNIVGISWPGIGKLSEIESKSDVWKRLEEVSCTENRSNRAIAQDVGIIYRFTKEMKKDDYVLVPNGSEIYIGKVLEDNPIYIKELDNDIDGFCHQRKIEWFFNKKSINKKVMTSRLYDSFKGQSTLFSTWFEVEIKNTDETKISPKYTTEGMIAKCWTIIDGKRYLLKKSTERNGKEVYSEYYIGQIAEIMEFEHTKYDIIDYYGDIVSCCQLFTDENIGFIPMEDFLERKEKFKTNINLLKIISKIYPREQLADLMLFDSLIYNTDRHLRNFGMLINNNTRKIIKAAPIFDNGNSIITLVKENSDIDKLLNRYISKIEINFDYLAKHFVCERHRQGLEKLKTFSFKRHHKYNLPDNILKKVELFIHKRAEISLKYLNKKI